MGPRRQGRRRGSRRRPARQGRDACEGRRRNRWVAGRGLRTVAGRTRAGRSAGRDAGQACQTLSECRLGVESGSRPGENGVFPPNLVSGRGPGEAKDEERSSKRKVQIPRHAACSLRTCSVAKNRGGCRLEARTTGSGSAALSPIPDVRNRRRIQDGASLHRLRTSGIGEGTGRAVHGKLPNPKATTRSPGRRPRALTRRLKGGDGLPGGGGEVR